MKKNYLVRYYIKANCMDFLMTMIVSASNAKEACSLCKDAVKARTGKNAFRPVAKVISPVAAETAK